MKFISPLIAVSNMEISKKFYQNILQQKIVLDFGTHVSFADNLALQSDFADLIGLKKDEVIQGSKNFELYFEEDDLDGFAEKLKNNQDIQYVHGIKEYPWGQRVIRFYDPDMHIIEVGESMEKVVTRFLAGGMSVEETAKRSMFPVEFVKKCLGKMK